MQSPFPVALQQDTKRHIVRACADVCDEIPALPTLSAKCLANLVVTFYCQQQRVMTAHLQQLRQDGYVVFQLLSTLEAQLVKEHVQRE